MRLRDVHMVPVSIHKLEDRLIGPRLIQCGECGRSFLSTATTTPQKLYPTGRTLNLDSYLMNDG